ncbi:O-antigen ligase family protein [Mesorhizobium sp. M1182]|uniref:O-antigen ligase family protein n=1 Tax=Mesorhizobium sp. M1182 TaxID=2957067 RepID=UPI00333D8820
MNASKPVPLYKDLWAWSFALAIAGYPLVGVLSSVSAAADDKLSIAFRVLVVFLCGLSFLFSGRQKAWRFGDAWLFCFAGLYMSKVGIDYRVDGDSDNLVFAVTTSVLPTAFLALSTNRWSEINAAWAVFVVGALTVVGIVWLQYSGSSAVMFDNSDRVYFERLNPISIGHAGLTALIASYTLMRTPQGKIVKSAILTVVALSAFTMYLASARGPLVAMLCCVALFPMLRPRLKTIIMGWVLLGGIVLVLATADMTPLVDKFHLTTSGTAATNSNVGRLEFIASSWELFQQNPLFGYGTHPPFGYPHNMFVEILQAMGLLGMAIFVGVFVKIAMAVRFLADRRLVLLPLLATQAFVGAQFSGSLWGSASLWIVVTVLIFRVNAMRSFDLWAGRRGMGRSYAQFGAPSGAR